MTLTKTQMTKKPDIEGKPLMLAASIPMDYSKAITKQIDRMAADIKNELRKLFEEIGQDQYAMDASIVSQARILMNALLNKWNPFFQRMAKKATDKMIAQVERNSAATLGMSLKEFSEQVTISRAGLMTPDVQEIMKASTEEAANLIKTLPQEYLADVQGAVMRSITTGAGMKDLVPFLNQKYKQNIRKARNVAQDQTRKVYNNLNAERMKKLGVKQFIWIHSGGGKEPRKLHKELNGEVCSYDDPPYIGDIYGNEVFGLPGQLPNCRCTQKPIINFEEM